MENSEELLNFRFDNSFAHKLEDFFVSCKSDPAISPKLLKFNHALAKELGLNPDLLNTEEGLAIFSGNKLPIGSEPLAQAYSGHQFGGFSPLLGDGRALLLGEVIDIRHDRKDIQLKGSGRTPFSRGGDGKSALGPVLREYLMSEAMQTLGVPTTRALAAVSTGEDVLRDTQLPGGILTRVASSHIRIGTFQFATTLGDRNKMRDLADYAIARHYPRSAEERNPYLSFFEEVKKAQSFLVARWMSVGFIHGVMNTDNMSISGETIDYGPCAFMDAYAEGTVFSSIDTQGRYAYANQPAILSWNLSRLAESLIPLVDENQDKAVELLTQSIEDIPSTYEVFWLKEMRAKVGITKENHGDVLLINELLSIMEKDKADFTLSFRSLSEALQGNDDAFLNLFNDLELPKNWLLRWKRCLEKQGQLNRITAKKMNTINPIYIPRNHKVEEALSASVHNQDMQPFEDLLDVLEKPYEESPGKEIFSKGAPFSKTTYKTYCGT